MALGRDHSLPVPPEDSYQKEFYQSLYNLVGGRMTVSPEFVTKTGRGGGMIDFLLSERGWVMSSSGTVIGSLLEHVTRFSASGPYGSRILLI